MSAYQGASYTYFHELLDTCTKHAQSIESQVKNLSEKVRLIGTTLDTPEMRARLDDDERRLHSVATKTKTILTELNEEMTKRKNQLNRNDSDRLTKVKTALGMAMKNFEDVIKDIGKKRQQFQKPNNSTLIDLENQDYTEDDVHRLLQTQRQMRLDNERLQKENEQDEIIETEVYKLQGDIIEINGLMIQIGAEVAEQGSIIEHVEHTTHTATDNIIAGNQQLTNASRHQKSYRKKLCWLLLIFLIIAVIVAVVIILKLKR